MGVWRLAAHCATMLGGALSVAVAVRRGKGFNLPKSAKS
jgi:hypothetical protein